ncbi:Clr5 domain-containing protein [Neurospora hispaniola]|uniref:Clr5 domain-containing protein n=1 Tax=Neurospora hispaniola TaxID=588809 RepID=A0AAJ0MS61_9PEZI|nr:Clr5 domain-containing protein [Neurospora hispaniola]
MSNLSERQSKLDKHRDTIYRLYITENKTLSQVIDIMKRDHNLLASDKKYKRYFKIWGFEKNYKTSEMISMLKMQQKRLREGKKTIFCNEHGQKIPKSKFTRFKNRHTIREFADEELQDVEIPRGITYKTPEPDDTKTRSKNRPSTNRTGERTGMGMEEPQVIPARSGSSLSMSYPNWSQCRDTDFTPTNASPAPSAYSLNTTIGAPTAPMAAYASRHHGQIETHFSPYSTAISDPGEYQLSASLRQSSVSSMPPLDLSDNRAGLFSSTVPSPALSAYMLNATLGCQISPVAAYTTTEQRSAYALDSLTQFSGAHTAGSVHLTAGARPGSSSYNNYQGNHVGPSRGTINSLATSASSLNNTCDLGASSAYPFNNTITAPVPLSSPKNGQGQSSANDPISPGLQLIDSGPSPACGQGEVLFGSGLDNYTGDYGRYDSIPTSNANNTYSLVLQPYLDGIEEYPYCNTKSYYIAGYQGGNGVDESLGFRSQSH